MKKRKTNLAGKNLYWKNNVSRKIPFLPKAVLFDFDGVIGDTMADNFLAWQAAFKKYGVTIKKNEYYLLEGKGVREIVKILGKKHGVSPKYFDDIVGSKEKNYLKKNKFRIFPGTLALLNRLKQQNIKTALVSGASRLRLYASLPKNLLNKFSLVLTADSVTHTKPHPQPYIKALAKLKIQKNRAVVVENAPLGILSAKRAGIFCIAVASTLPAKYLSGADLITDKIEFLKAIM